MARKEKNPKEDNGKNVKKNNAKKVKEDEVKNKRNNKKAWSRCSPTYFRNVLDEVVPKLGDKQKERIKNTPLAPWLEMPELPISRSRIDIVLKRFHESSRTFEFGDGIVIPFTSIDFSIVLGLDHVGQPIDLDANIESKFVARRFAGNLGNADRKHIHKKLCLLAGSHKESDIDDFLRLFICLVFNCVVFPVGNYSTPRFIMSYIDDLSTFFDYSWGDAAYKFLCHQIFAHTGYGQGNVAAKTYVDGCTVGLMAWLYEKIPSFGHARSLRSFPRLFRWDESKIPKNTIAAEKLFKRIDFSRVLDIVPFPEEEKLLRDKQGSSLVVPCMRCFRADNVGKSNKSFAKSEMKGESASVADKVDDDEKFSEDVGGEKGNFNVLDENENENIDVQVSGDIELSRLIELSVEKKILSGDNFDEGDSINTSHVSGSLLVADTVNHFPSSIAKTVRTRVDRVKKKKAEMFVTPPSSTPKRRRKQSKQVLQSKDYILLASGGDMDDEANERKLDKFRGRSDFLGSEEASDEEKKVLAEFLCSEKLNVVVWEDESFFLEGHTLCDFLFGEEVMGDIINCYMRIVKAYSLQNGFEIFFMDTQTQTEVLEKLKEFSKRDILEENNYEDFLGKLTSVTRNQLQQLNKDLFERCRYLIFPVNSRNHWFLLVYRSVDKQFKIMNSMHDAVAVRKSKVFVQFLAGFMRHFTNWDIGQPEVLRQRCRDQGPTLDCGVFVCMWVECLARDDEFWIYEKNVKMDTFRARVASSILSHGLLKNML